MGGLLIGITSEDDYSVPLSRKENQWIFSCLKVTGDDKMTKVQLAPHNHHQSGILDRAWLSCFV